MLVTGVQGEVHVACDEDIPPVVVLVTTCSLCEDIQVLVTGVQGELHVACDEDEGCKASYM